MRSPVLFIIFNRPETTARVLAAIRQARPPRLYIAADGPRPDREGEEDHCREARNVAMAVDWPCEVKTLFRARNLGCRHAVFSAITWFFKHEPEGIILEDDVVPHPDFFPFCDTLLEHYRDTPEVMQITGNNFQLGVRRGEASYYFSRFGHIWGWASWARAWNLCDLSMPGYREFMREEFLKRDKPLGRNEIFGSSGLPPAAAEHFTSVFRKIDRGVLDSWAYSWQYCLFRHNGLTATPNHALAENIGFSGGAHYAGDSLFAHSKAGPLPQPLSHPPKVAADDEADTAAYNLVWKPGGTALDTLLKLGVERLRSGHAYANRELIRTARSFYGDDPALDELETVSKRAETPGGSL